MYSNFPAFFQLVKQGMDMTLPLRGVTALSLSLYLKHLEMTVELLTALRKTRQIGKYTKYFETKTSCHPMGPIISFIDGRSLSRHRQRFCIHQLPY